MKAAWAHTALEKTARFWRDPFALIIVVLAGLGTAHILVRTATYGAGVGEDSIVFLSTALNFLAGEGWRDFTGRPMATWPPLFPLLLAAFGWVGIEPLEAGRWVNATAFGLTILAAGGWLRSHLRSRLLVLVATATLTASLPLTHFASYLMTDFLFVLFTLLALIKLASFLHRGGRTSLQWAAVLTALAALTRYPGVVLIGVGVLMLLVRRTPPLAVRLKHVVVFGAVSSIPLAGVMTRNWMVSGSLTKRRGRGSGQSLSDGLSQVVDVFRGWVVSPHAPDWLGYILWMAAGLVVVLAALGLGLGGSKGKDRVAGAGLPFGVFAVSYLAFLVAVVPFTVHQIIDSRYLLPIYVPLLLMASFLLDRFLSMESAGWMAAVRYGLASLVLLGALAHIGFSAHRNLTITAEAWGAGFGRYNNTYCASSEILNYIRDNPIDGRVYSRDRRLAWFWDRTAAIGKHHLLPAEIHNFTSAIMEETNGDGGHVLWFRKWEPASAYDLDELDIRCLPGVEVVAELADGVVFRVTATEPFNAERHRAQKERYQERYVEQLLAQAGERVVRSGWDVYRNGRKLTYFKKPCAPADVQAKFVLHVVPVDPADLPVRRRRFGSDNLDFYFDQHGFYLGDWCIAIIPLPDYAINRIHIGQWISAEDRTLWKAEFAPSR